MYNVKENLIYLHSRNQEHQGHIQIVVGNLFIIVDYY